MFGFKERKNKYPPYFKLYDLRFHLKLHILKEKLQNLKTLGKFIKSIRLFHRWHLKTMFKKISPE